MKTNLSCGVGFLYRAVIPCFAALLLIGPPAARARTITLSLEFTRLQFSVFDQYNPGQTYYTVITKVSSDTPPVTYDEVDSSTNNSAFGGSENGYGYGYYSDIGSAVNAATNGAWTLTVNKGDVSQKQYTFTVSATGLLLTDNNLPTVQITTPVDGNTAVSTNSAFAWTGPATWDELDLVARTPDYSFYASDSPSAATTSWSAAPLPLGTNLLEVTYKTNAAAWITISTPLDNLSHPFTNWVGGAKLVDYAQSDFVTSTNPATLSGGHSLIAHYTFDNSGSLGSDSSGQGNDINNCSSSWGSGQGHVFSTDSIAGGGAVQFFGYSSMTPCGQAFTSWTNTLAGSFTVSAWINTTNVVGNDGDNLSDGNGQSIIYADNNNLGATPVALTGTKAAFRTTDPNGNDDTLHSLQSVTSGNYVHVVATRDQATGEKKIYINGTLDNADFASTESLTGAGYISIGGEMFSAYKGLVDDVQIYSGVLSASEVAYLYNNPGSNVADVSANNLELNTALGTTNLNWASSGDTSWFVETTNTYNGSPAAAQSGSVTNSEYSKLSVNVTGPGTLTFYWSSIANDPNQGFYYEFDVDGTQNDGYYGTFSWQQDGPFAIPAGTHTLSWMVTANGDTDPTQAGYLDQVSFVQDTAPVITLNPFNQTNYPGYSVALLAAATNAANSPTTWQWFKVGNVSPIPNATNALFIPTNSGTAGVVGSYYAVASTPGGSTPTTTASVSFISAPLPPDWAHALKSPFYPVNGSVFNKDYYLGCAVDSAGDIYAAAQYFSNMNVVTNGNDANVLTAPGSYGAALVKHSASGNALWAVGLTNNQLGHSYGTTLAAAPGNGAYLGSVIYGTNWLGTNKFVDVGGGSILLSRFDANGSNVWSKFIGGTNTVWTSYNMLVSDASGNVTLSGNMSGTVGFGGTNLSSPAGGGFIVQYDANGTVRWAQTIPVYTYGLAYGNGLLYASLQSTVSAGVTNASIGSLSNVTDRAWAVACLNATNGQPLWLRGVGHPYGANFSGEINDMPLIAASGTNVFLTANTYGSSVVFGGISIPLPGGRGQYFARYDTNGTPRAASVFGSPTTMIWASAANASGVYVSGDFDSYSQFGNLVIAAPLFTTNDLDFSYNGFEYVYFTQPLVAKFDLNGNPLWARSGVSSAFANFRGIATTSDGVWASGFLKVKDISSPAQFGTNYVSSDLYVPGSGPSTIIFTQAGMIAKITDGAAGPLSVTLFNSLNKGGTNFQFQFLSQSGFNHSILYRTNLAVGTWLTNSTIVGDGTVKTNSLPYSLFSPAKQGFIRVSTQ